MLPPLPLSRAAALPPVKWVEGMKCPSPPFREAKGYLIDERASLLWDRGWGHKDYTAFINEIRTEQLRSPSGLNWRAHAYRKSVFAEIERRADLDAWVEPHSLAGSTFLCPDSLTTDLDELLVQKKGSVHGMPMILRAGIDNCNLGWSLHTQAGYPGYALEVFTAGCMAIYATAARCRILDPGPGRVAPWREKICERAHQGIKSNVSKSRHMLRWALARARHGERKRVTE